MTNKYDDSRMERDSMGEIAVPAGALYGAQTQRAVENFPISGWRLPPQLIHALGLIKLAAAQVNRDLGRLEALLAEAIITAARGVATGQYDEHFPIDVFQTGSGTSTNMNANEVIANVANLQLGGILGSQAPVHPNDHVNLGQSSNDVMPSAIHIAAYRMATEDLLPALRHLQQTMTKQSAAYDQVVMTGRTHLMDAMPVRLGQVFSGWASQIDHGVRAVESAFPALAELALGGTAVGTGVNTHPEFGRRVAARLAEETGLPFREAENHFEAQSAQDGAVEFSGQLKRVATSLLKIAQDLRWMNSGPVSGLAEIQLPALQPGSSIMPGKVNPVIPEAVIQVATQVIGQDLIVTMSGASGNFQLNAMLPVIAYNLLSAMMLMSRAARLLADKAIAILQVNEKKLAAMVERNAILATALTPYIGYDAASRIVKQAMKEGRSIKAIALERTKLSATELDDLLDPHHLT